MGPVIVKPVTSSPPRTVWLPTMRQDWLDAAFLHWEADPDLVAAWLPNGVGVDRFQGKTFVGLIGLRIRAAPPGLPTIPYLGVFPEVNVRVYSVDTQGRRGIVFCSLDAGRLVPALAGRGGYRLPYTWAEGRAARDGDILTYSMRRRWPTRNHPGTRFSCRIGPRLSDPTPLEHFLTARWILHWSWFGHSLWAGAQHRPWILHSAELLDVDDDLIAAAGFPRPTTQSLSVLYSPGVSAHIGPPAPLTLGTAGASRRQPPPHP